ncbi:hypothetical protein ACQ4LE_002332 [Meloidogyne hapla]
MVKAASIGARSQSARTYLEKHFDEYENSTEQNVIIRHALLALKETLQTNAKLDENVFFLIFNKYFLNKNIFLKNFYFLRIQQLRLLVNNANLGVFHQNKLKKLLKVLITIKLLLQMSNQCNFKNSDDFQTFFEFFFGFSSFNIIFSCFK